MVKAEKAFKWGIAIVIIFGILNAFYFLNLIIALKIALPILCVFLIGAILLQSGKGGGLAAIGGLGDQAAFGTRTSTFLTKVTYLIGAAFIVATIFLFKLSINMNVMHTKITQPASEAQHEHTHDHPDHEEHEGEHDHPDVPQAGNGGDTTSKFGMQNIPEEPARPAHEQPMSEGKAPGNQSPDTHPAGEGEQTSNVTEEPIAEEETKTGQNSSE